MTNPIDKAQPEALRLAQWLDENSSGVYRPAAEAAAELRRLHADLEHADRYAEQMGRELAKAHTEIEACRAEAARLDFIEKAVLRHDLCKWGAYGYTFAPRLASYDPIIQVCFPNIRDLADAAIQARAAMKEKTP